MRSQIKKHALLRPLYGRVIGGIPGLGTPAEVVARFTGSADAPAAQADRIIRFYTLLSGMTGFVTGLPGLLGQLVTLPADVAGTAILQLHLCAAFAVLAGRNPADPATRDLCIDCVLGNTEREDEVDDAEEAATRFGLKLLERGARFGAEFALGRVAKNVARRLPIVGGVVGGASDVYSTRRVGLAAQRVFLGQTLKATREAE